MDEPDKIINHQIESPGTQYSESGTVVPQLEDFELNITEETKPLIIRQFDEIYRRTGWRPNDFREAQPPIGLPAYPIGTGQQPTGTSTTNHHQVRHGQRLVVKNIFNRWNSHIWNFCVTTINRFVNRFV